MTEGKKAGQLYELVVIDVGGIDLDQSPEHLQFLTNARDSGVIVIVIVPDMRSSVIGTFYRLVLGAYVTKPITSSKLEDAFVKYIKRRQELPEQAERAGLKILMAENSVDNQRLVEAYLKMDGLTATKLIRVWEKETNRKTTPITALTAHAYEEEVRRSLDAGCSIHLTKPLEKPPCVGK